MARYTAVLLEPLHAQLRAQAEEIGTLRERTAHLQTELERRDGELEQTRAQLAEATAPEAPEPGPPPEPEPRRWWQRLLWG